MVDTSAIIADIRKMVDAGKYFTINRARQYGKTTTLNALKQILENDYIVLSLSFEGITSAGFQSEGEFVQIFSRLILDLNEFHGVSIPDISREVQDRVKKSIETMTGLEVAEVNVKIVNVQMDNH